MNEPNVPHHYDRRPADYPRREKPRYGWRDDNGQPIHDIDEEGNPICGRICSRTKQPCRRSGPHLARNGRCCTVGHGGKSPGAPLKHGRYSIFLSDRMAASYEDALTDDVLLNVREHIALTAAMIEEKLAGFQQPGPAERWAEAIAASAAVRTAALAQDLPALLLSLDRLDDILNNGQGLRQNEKDLQALMTTSAKLSKFEMERLEKMQQFVTRQQMAAIQSKIVRSLQTHIEPSALAKVCRDLVEVQAPLRYPRRRTQWESPEQQQFSAQQ